MSWLIKKYQIYYTVHMHDAKEAYKILVLQSIMNAMHYMTCYSLLHAESKMSMLFVNESLIIFGVVGQLDLQQILH